MRWLPQASYPAENCVHVIYLGAAEQTSHGAWFLHALLNVEREKEVATEK